MSSVRDENESSFCFKPHSLKVMALGTREKLSLPVSLPPLGRPPFSISLSISLSFVDIFYFLHPFQNRSQKSRLTKRADPVMLRKTPCPSIN
jgi:hypothetical protein